ncbi:MAG: tetratricopeptide repeat protein [Gemmataceae bacterium]
MSEKTLFVAALEIKDSAERAAFLAHACGDDARLRERIEALLRRHERMDASALSAEGTPNLSDVPTLGEVEEGTPTEEQNGLIGPYRLLMKLGEGGMGTVWMAEQSQPMQRVVALKVIKAGMASAPVLARFDAERQALALMDHPNIAKVLDAGSTTEGRPYFVMELVRGVPLTHFCDQQQLTPRQRLQLFVLVCQAVQHAHQKGIIHRDLKPSNVLVASYDDKPVPKIIDFGIAKAISQKLSESPVLTEVGVLVGTLEYMSPEQAELTNLDIDTRADVYSLGVLLYELLTGTTPFNRWQLGGTGIVEGLRIIREVEPPRPSARLSSEKNQAAIAATRKLEPRRLVKEVRGELDWIVMKCLEKERGRRYQSAHGLARDIERYLAEEPVLAGPPSATYRLRKFVSRHKGSVLAAALLLLALVGGIAGTTLGWLEAQRQRDEADQHRSTAETSAAKALQAEAEVRTVLTFFQDKVLAAARPKEQEGGLGVDASIQAAVDAAEPKIAVAFQDQPRVEAEVRHALGLTYLYLSQFRKAIRQFERTVELRKAHLGPDHPDTLASMHHLAWAYQDDGRMKDAEALAKQTLARRQALLGPDHYDTLVSMHRLAFVYLESARWEEALTLYKQTLELSKANLGMDHPLTLGTMNDLGLLYKQTNRLQEALPLYQESLRRRRAAFGADHPDTLESMNNLAMAYIAAGRPQEAAPLLEETWERKKTRLGPNHRETLTTMNNLGEAYMNAGRLKEALPLLEEARKGREAALGPNHRLTLISMSDLVHAYRQAGRFQEAVALGEETLKRRQTVLGAGHPETLTSMNALALAYRSAGRLQEAAKIFEKTIEGQIAHRGPDHPYVFITKMSLAQTYRDMGRPNDALPLAESAALAYRTRFGMDHPYTRRFLNELANLYESVKQPDKAESIWRELADALRKNVEKDPRIYGAALMYVGRNLLKQQKFADAEALLRESLAIRQDKEPDLWMTFYTQSLLGASLLDQKKYAESEPLLVQGYQGMNERADKIPSQDKVHLREAIERLVQLYDAWGKKDKADEWRKKLDTRKKADPSVSPSRDR